MGSTLFLPVHPLQEALLSPRQGQVPSLHSPSPLGSSIPALLTLGSTCLGMGLSSPPDLEPQEGRAGDLLVITVTLIILSTGCDPEQMPSAC